MALRRGVLKSRRPHQHDDGVDKEMCVFGYACRVFASTSDDDGNVQPLLIPWQDDATLTMDR
jgi:hypothetical protein